MILITPHLAVMTVFAAFGIAQGDEPPTTTSVGPVIEGRVVDHRQAPIAGALVLLRPNPSVPFAEGASARTDAEGRYRIDLTKAYPGASRLKSMVLATGFAVAAGTVNAGSGQAKADFTLTAEAWKTTEVVVTDRSGGSGAGVELICSVGRSVVWSRSKTDAEGHCGIQAPTGEPMTLQVRPAGARSIITTLMNGKDDPTALTIPLLPPILGRVHDTEGRPLPGVTVGRWIAARQGDPSVHPHRSATTVTTDVDGRFELAPPITIRVHAFYRSDRSRIPETLCFADRQFRHLAFRFYDVAGPIEPLDIALEPGRLVRIPIECDSAHSSPAAGRLSVSMDRSPDFPDFDPVVLSNPLSREELIRGKSIIEVRLPKGKYKLSLVCYTDGGIGLGEATQEVTVDSGEVPLSLPPMRNDPAPHQKLVGKAAPQVDATDRDTGQPVTLADFRGKVVVLDFWGYWCGPCNGAMPYLADLHRRYDGRPLAIVALHDQSVQSRADYDRRTAFARKSFWDGHDLSFHVLFDRPDPSKAEDRAPEGTGITCRRYEISAFPTLFVIDQQGTIIATLGNTEHERLETLINKLLGD
jgi:thiol-disulfide isomerase/thioredoxin